MREVIERKHRAVGLREAKLFLRVEDEAEDDNITDLVGRATEVVETATGVGLTETSPAPLRLAVLMMVLRAFERRDDVTSLSVVEEWIAPYRLKAHPSKSIGGREAS